MQLLREVCAGTLLGAKHSGEDALVGLAAVAVKAINVGDESVEQHHACRDADRHQNVVPHNHLDGDIVSVSAH